MDSSTCGWQFVVIVFLTLLVLLLASSSCCARFLLLDHLVIQYVNLLHQALLAAPCSTFVLDAPTLKSAPSNIWSFQRSVSRTHDTLLDVSDAVFNVFQIHSLVARFHAPELHEGQVHNLEAMKLMIRADRIDVLGAFDHMGVRE